MKCREKKSLQMKNTKKCAIKNLVKNDVYSMIAKKNCSDKIIAQKKKNNRNAQSTALLLLFDDDKVKGVQKKYSDCVRERQMRNSFLCA